MERVHREDFDVAAVKLLEEDDGRDTGVLRKSGTGGVGDVGNDPGDPAPPRSRRSP